MKIIAISDTHAKWQGLKIPECDVLISAGDYSFRGESRLVKDFHEWLNKQDAGYIISVQGNHEVLVERSFQENKELAIKACPSVEFMDEGPLTIEGHKFWCSAWTPWFHDWAWNANRGEEIKRHWDLIPDDTEVLITHGPPYGIRDELEFPDGTPNGKHVGCSDLLNRIKQLKKLKIHIFGHIHSGYGQEHIDGVSYYNASICDETYTASNPITEIEWI